MKYTIALVLLVSVMTGCADRENKETPDNERTELIPEPDKDLRKAYEKSMIQVQPDTPVFVDSENRAIPKQKR